MPSTTSGYRYPSPTTAPDVPGDIYNLALDIENKLGTTTFGAWNPGISGSGGAAQGGSGSGSSGTWARQGPLYRFVGTIVFGSGATFGNGDTTVTNLPVPLDTGVANGTGWYNNAGSPIQQVFFVAASTTSMRLYQPIAGSSQFFSGSIPSGSRLSFTFNGPAA